MKSVLTLGEFRDKYRDEILRLAKEHGIADVRVFGSLARGDNNAKSDVDLLIRLLPKSDILDRVAFTREVQLLVGGKVDVVNDRAIKARIREAVLAEAVEL